MYTGLVAFQILIRKGVCAMSQSIRGFHKALVIFIDILGSQNRKDFNELYEINNTFHDLLLDNQKCNKPRVVYKRTIHTFSDCAYIIYDFKDDIPEEKRDLGKLFEVALCNCEPLAIQFLNRNFIFRGGVAYGDVYYEENRNILFGPGINAAYQLESKVAQYPRIAVENFVAETIQEHWDRTVREMDNPQNDKEKNIYRLFGNLKKVQGCIVKRDFDGICMMHYLNSIEINCSNASFINKSNEEFLQSCVEFCKQQIEENKENLHITQKYDWLLSYIISAYSCFEHKMYGEIL